jgi:hypothetical protein
VSERLRLIVPFSSRQRSSKPSSHWSLAMENSLQSEIEVEAGWLQLQVCCEFS